MSVATSKVVQLGQSPRTAILTVNVSRVVAEGRLTNHTFACSLRADRANRWSTHFIVGAHLVHCPSCSEPIRLEPEGKRLWTFPVLLAEFPVGDALLECSLTVSAGKRCDRLYGCFTAPVDSPGRQISIADPARP